MAIWSLTKERVEKLLQRVGDKEQEIDALIKLSVKDLWNRDLDEFIAEWRFQLEDDRKRQRKVANLGRRASNKLKINAKGPGAKKRKAQGDDPDDSDFGVSKPKKAGTANRVQPKSTSSFFQQFSPPRAAAPVKKALTNGVAASKAAAPVKAEVTATDGASDPVVEAVELGPSPSRRPRAVTSKAIKYGGGSDSDSDNGDDLLGDVSKMVRTVGADLGDSKAGPSRPLFSTSMSRPGSSAGLHKTKSKQSLRKDDEFDPDETDFSKLVPQTTGGRQSMALGQLQSAEEADEYSEIVEEPPAKIKKATKAATTNPTKAATAAKAKKPAPAKKVPAAKGAKAKRVVDEDEDEVEAVADELLDSDAATPPVKTTARPSRRAAATKKKAAYLDSESEEGDEEEASKDFDESE